MVKNPRKSLQTPRQIVLRKKGPRLNGTWQEIGPRLEGLSSTPASQPCAGIFYLPRDVI